MPLVARQHEWLKGIITGLTSLSDNRWMMPSPHLTIILEELGSVIEREVTGVVVEMGCAGGRTSLKLAAFLQLLGEGPGRQLHLYDSFVGFPTLTKEDNPGYRLEKGLEEGIDILKYPKHGIPELFKEWGAGLLPPIIHKGFFDTNSSLSNPHPEPIAFCFIDCDAHNSIRTSLNIVWPRLASGGTLVIHDYNNNSWPGCKLAVDNFFNSIPNTYISRKYVSHETLLVITKR